MDTLLAGLLGAKARREGREAKVFDWDYAATLLRLFASDGIKDVEVCLLQDEGNTYAYAIEDKKININKGYAYLSSVWATPGMIIYYDDGHEVTVPCFKMQHEVPNWDCDTWWPDSALDILRGGKHGLQK